MKKRILSLLLAIITVAALALPNAGSVMAASYQEYKYVEYDAALGEETEYSCTWKYEPKEKALYFSEGVIPPPTYLGVDDENAFPWEKYFSELKKLVIGAGVAKNSEIESISEMCGHLTDYWVHADNPYFASKDGILYDKKMTEIICVPPAWNKKTYTAPKSFSDTQSLLLLPRTLEEMKVEKGNKTLIAKNGVLYDKQMTKIIFYPYSRKATTYTVPKTVKIDPYSKDVPSYMQWISSIMFPSCLEKFQVEKGNPYHTAKDGVLYDKKMTQLIRYPLGKKAISYQLPATINYKDFAASSGIAGNINLIDIQNSRFTCVIYSSKKFDHSKLAPEFVKLYSLPNVKNHAPSKISNFRIDIVTPAGIEFTCDSVDVSKSDGFVLYQYNAKTKKYEELFAVSILELNEGSPIFYWSGKNGKLPTVKTKYGLKSFALQKDGSIKYSAMATCTYTPKK